MHLGPFLCQDDVGTLKANVGLVSCLKRFLVGRLGIKDTCGAALPFDFRTAFVPMSAGPVMCITLISTQAS